MITLHMAVIGPNNYITTLGGVGPIDYNITWGEGSLKTHKDDYVIHGQPLPTLFYTIALAVTITNTNANTTKGIIKQDWT